MYDTIALCTYITIYIYICMYMQYIHSHYESVYSEIERPHPSFMRVSTMLLCHSQCHSLSPPVDVDIHCPLHPTITLVSSIGESGGVCGVNVECCTAPIGGLVHCELRGGRYWLSSPIHPCQWLCGVICGAVYDCHTAGAVRREDVTNIGVISNTVVKDDCIVWYEVVVATEDSPT